MKTLADFHRLAVAAGEHKLAAAIAPALPRLPVDLLRECAQAAGIATASTEEMQP